MEQHTKELYERLQTLTLLRPLLREPLLQSFSAMMESMLSLADGNKTPLSAAVSAYCDFTSEIYRCYAENEREISGNFSHCLYGLLFRTETDYLKAKARKKDFSPFLEQQLDKELEILQNLSLLTAEKVQKSLQDAGFTILCHAGKHLYWISTRITANTWMPCPIQAMAYTHNTTPSCSVMEQSIR